MRVIELSLQQVDNETAASVRVCIEEHRGHGYSRTSAIDIMSKTPEAQRRILLADNQRLVVEPIVTHEVVYDKDQMAAVPKAIDTKVPTAQEAPGAFGPRVVKEPTVAPVEPKIPVHQAANSPKPGDVKPSQTPPTPTSPMGTAMSKNQAATEPTAKNPSATEASPAKNPNPVDPEKKSNTVGVSSTKDIKG